MFLRKILLLTLTFMAALSVLGALFERPVLLSYITSNSMHPTLSEDDLIIINPFSKNYRVGDIIVFYTGEKWVCHRIFAKTEEGYLTKGDNNVAIDQIEGMPAIKPERIAGKVITIGGRPLKVPNVGSKIENFSNFMLGNKHLAAVLFTVLGGLSLISPKGTKKRRKRFVKLTYQQVYTILSVFILFTFSLASSSIIREVEIGYGTTTAGNSKPGWVYPGERFERTVEIGNYGVVPMIFSVVSDSERARVHETFLLFPGERKVVVVEIHAPKDTRIYYERITVGKFLPILPQALVKTLSEVSVYLVVLVEVLVVAALLIFGYKISEVRERYRIRWVTRL